MVSKDLYVGPIGAEGTPTIRVSHAPLRDYPAVDIYLEGNLVATVEHYPDGGIHAHVWEEGNDDQPDISIAIRGIPWAI